MVKIQGNYIYIKDVEAPTGPLTVTVRGGLGEYEPNTKQYCKDGTITLDLSPVNYIGNHVDAFEDFKDYLAAICTQIINECCFSNSDDMVKALKIIRPKSTDEQINYIIKLKSDFRSALNNREFYRHVLVSSIDDLFCVFIESVDMNMTFFDRLIPDKTDLFYAIFVNNSVATGLQKDNDNTYSYKFNDKLFDLGRITQTLLNIFLYYAFPERRKIDFTGNMNRLKLLDKARFENCEILLWDDNLEKYMFYDVRPANAFYIGTICPEFKVKHCMTEKTECIHTDYKERFGETYDPIESKLILHSNTDETFVTKPIKKSTIYGYDKPCSYIGYRFYDDAKTKKKNGVSIMLFTSLQNGYQASRMNDVVYANRIRVLNILFDREDHSKAILPYENFKFYDFKECLKSDKVNIRCNIAFFGTSSGVTYKDHFELEKYKIPKQKRDEVYRALCDVCEELDVDLEKVTEKLNLDFTKFYKK